MWRAPARRAHHVARFPLEFIREPVKAVGATFDDNFVATFSHHSKETVTIDDSKRLDPPVSYGEQARPFCVRFERGENEPCINRQRNNDHGNRRVS